MHFSSTNPKHSGFSGSGKTQDYAMNQTGFVLQQHFLSALKALRADGSAHPFIQLKEISHSLTQKSHEGHCVKHGDKLSHILLFPIPCLGGCYLRAVFY